MYYSSYHLERPNFNDCIAKMDNSWMLNKN